MSEAATKRGEFETFRSDWLLQVAADREAKAALPVAIVLACKHLNRTTGTAWPAVDTLIAATGADAKNTVRTALKVLEKGGHAAIEWTKGGKGKTNVVTPLVNGKPFKFLKGYRCIRTLQKVEGFGEFKPFNF
jgi:hypothetical protein